MSDHSRSARSRLAASFLPTTAVLEMTYRCNHQCLFCSCPWEDPAGRFSRLPELSVAEWKEVIRQLTARGVTDLAFTGGEPLLKDGLFEIMEFAASTVTEYVEAGEGGLTSRQGSPRLHLLSNGAAVDRQALEFCRRWQVQLSLSLPGLETFREHTGGGDPDAVLQRFREAAAWDIRTVVGVTVTRRNLGELYETAAAAFLAGAERLLLNRFLPGGRGLQHAAQLSLDASQLRAMLDTAEDVLREANRYGGVGTELPHCLVPRDRYERLEVGTRCGAVIRFFAIDPSGYVRTCNHSPIRLNHVRELDAVRTNPHWRRFARKDYLPAACGGCRERSGCDGGCREAAHIVGGDLASPDPVFADAERDAMRQTTLGERVSWD
jgi:radical SAM protein with 4Fe4S-binding SPASM domain